MMKYLCLIVIFLIPCVLNAGEWVAVDGAVVEIKLNKEEIENKLWLYIADVSSNDFKPKEEYTYQYKVVNHNEIYINALCDTVGKKSLHTELVIVLDGGSCYFQINYNRKTGKFFNLRVNGEA